MLTMGEETKINGPLQAAYRQILTPAALTFLTKLQKTFNPVRLELLEARKRRQHELDRGALPTFLPDTVEIRKSGWQVAPAPPDLQKRWVEITGPVDRKMIINALNSGADVFMADFEDSLSPTWDNVMQGQINLRDAVRRLIEFKNPDGRIYTLNGESARLLVRPRGWHLDEPRMQIDGQPVSASLFDFGLYFFHNAQELIWRGTGPYFYLPKLESHREARLWNEIFNALEEIRKRDFPVRVVVLTAFGDGSSIQSALELRAEGFALKTESPVQLIEAIRQVAQGRIIFPAAAQRWFMNQARQETDKTPNDLSAREWEVIECTAKGMTNPEIAQSLGVSANTVRFHLKSIFGKIQVSNRTEAAAWYFAHKGE